MGGGQGAHHPYMTMSQQQRHGGTNYQARSEYYGQQAEQEEKKSKSLNTTPA